MTLGSSQAQWSIEWGACIAIYDHLGYADPEEAIFGWSGDILYSLVRSHCRGVVRILLRGVLEIEMQ